MTTYWNDGTELYHYGVKGQRWGHRQYQNEDGSLTEEGRRHYGVGQSLSNAGKAVRRNVENRYNKYYDRQEARIDKREQKQMTSLERRRNKLGEEKYEYRKAKAQMAYEHQRKALDINRNLPLGEQIAKDMFFSDGHSFGSEAYSSLLESGMTKRGAQWTLAMLGASGGTLVAYARNSKSDREKLKNRS